MPIQHDLRVIFQHNPKTAGTSVCNALSIGQGHEFLYAARARYIEWWDSYFKFGFVREPMDRLISAYEYALMPKSYWHDNVNPNTSEDERILRSHQDYDTIIKLSFEQVINSLLRNPCSFLHVGWLAQHHFVGKELDFIGRFENLHEDFAKVCGILKVNVELPKENPTIRRLDWKTYYTEENCEKVYRLYKDDYDMFGYGKPSKADLV